MKYSAVVLHLHDGRFIDVDLHYSGSGWTSELRALRRACKRLGIDLSWGDWAYMGGNMWSAHDILNA